jgi:GTPase SAR1 family protein
VEKTLANFDLKRLPTKVARQFKVLLDGSFLDRQVNLLLFGSPGAGKSHLLSALGHEMVNRGRRMKYATFEQHLLRQLIALRTECHCEVLAREIWRHSALVGAEFSRAHLIAPSKFEIRQELLSYPMREDVKRKISPGPLVGGIYSACIQPTAGSSAAVGLPCAS